MYNLLNFNISSLTILFLVFNTSDSYAQEKNIKIFIPFNSFETNFHGLPIKNSYGECSLVSGIDSTWLFRLTDGSQISFIKYRNDISFTFSSDSLTIEGQFTVPPCCIATLKTHIDPETFDLVLHKEEYYLPFRSGIWRYTTAIGTDSVEYKKIRIGDSCN